MPTNPKFTGMVVVSGGRNGERGPFQNDVMTILEMEALLWSGEERSTQSGWREPRKCRDDKSENPF